MADAPTRGRPRLSPEDVKARIQAYCRRYGVTAGPEGLPPFPSGKRETPQHRAWMAVYKAHQRLGRVGGASLEDRRALLASQDGACEVCARPLAIAEAVLLKTSDGRSLALHPACHGLAVSAEAAGPEAVDHLRAYLWPAASRPPKRRA
jgi:hypothetical protein